MAAVLEQLSEELAQTPGDQELLKRLAQTCVEAGELGRMKGALEPVFSALSGPLAVRPAAEALAAALVDGAAKLGARAPRDALDLYLRAAKLLAQVAMDKVAAAKVLATAWELLPDERVATAAQALFPGTHEAPEYTLEALAEVGGDGPKTAALRKLAAAELERRRLDQAESFFARLEALRPNDADASAGRTVIAELRAAARAKTESLDEAIAAAPAGAARGALWRARGEAARSAGRLAEAEAAFRAALEDGDEAALRPLEALLRETGRVDEVAAVVEELAARARGDRQVALRKKLFSLLRDELKRPDEAQRVLAAPRNAPAPTAVEVLRSQVEEVAQRDPLAGALRLEELAAAEDDRQARLALLERAATLVAGRDAQVEARLWRKVKALDPQSPGALAFHRLFYEAHPDPRRAYSNLLQLHAITADPDARRALAIEMATLAEEGLGQLDKAIDAWRLVERDLPREAEVEATQAVWAELRRLYAAAGRWHAYVDLLDRWGAAAAALGNQELLVELLFDIVDVYQDPARLPMPAMVLQTYQRIVALSPTHTVALDRLAVGLAEREQWTDLLQVLAQKVELTDDPSELVALFQQIADLYLDHVRSESQAIVVLERLLELTPDDLDVVRRLRDLYRRRHDSERHLNALTRELELTSDPDERMRIFSDLAKLAQDELLRPVDAIAYHREILVLAPAHEPSLAALQALHAEQEDWAAYAKVLEQRVAEAKTKAAKLPLLLELGEAMLTRLGDVERAEQIFSAIAESSPTSATARRFLQRIFVSRKKWDELARLFTKSNRATPAAPGSRWKEYVALLRDAVKHEVDPPLVAAIHVEIARAFEVELDDRKSAAEHLELALRACEDEIAWARKALELLGDDALGPRRLVALTTIARHAPDARERYQAWMSIGLIHRRAKDSVHACDAWGRALVLGVELGLIEPLAHLEEDAGATGRWEQAFLAIDEALGHLPTAEGDGATLGLRVALHRALGNIARARLLRPEEAVRHFKWVLQLAPGDAFALEELEKIYFSLNDLSGLEDVYRARIDAASTDAERTAPLHALARLFDDVLLDPERAAGTYQEILRVVPDDRVAQDALLRSLEASGASAEIAAVLEGILARTRDLERRQALQWRLAELFANELADPVGAIDHCREIVERAEPGQAELIARPLVILEGYASEPMLAREVAPVLELAYRKLGRLVDLARLLEVQAKTASPEALPGILDELVMLAQGALDDPRKAFEVMLQRFRLTPEEPELWAELERAAGPLDAWEGLAAAWKDRVEAAPEMAPEARALLRLRLAEVYHRRLIELEDAIVETERALSETHDDAVTLRALESLEVLFKKTADLDSFVRVKLESARRVLSRASRRQKVIEAAQALAGALGRPEDALGVLEPLWLEEPGDVELADLVLALAERLGDDKRTDQFFGDAIEAARDDERRDALRYRRALVRRDRLGLWEVAISELIDLVESPHAGRDARQTLLDLCRAQESAAQRDVVLEVLIEHYRRVRDTEGTISALVVQAEFAGDGEPRAAVLREAASECLPDPTQAATHREGAQHAFDLYGQALFEHPADSASLDALRVLARELGHWHELAEVLAMVADHATADGPPWGEGAFGARAIMREEARIAHEELQDDARAISVLSRELELADGLGATDLMPTLVVLDGLYRAAGDDDARRDTLQRMAMTAVDPIERASHLETLALLELGAEHIDEAVAGLEGALEELGAAPREAGRETRQRVLATLESVLQASERRVELVDLLVAAAATEDDVAEHRELLHRAAEVAADELGDGARAVALYGQLAAEDPHDEVALARLVALHSEAARWPETLDALGRQRDLAAGAGALGEARAIEFRMSLVELDELGDPDTSLATLARILAGDAAHEGAIETLGRIERRFPAHGRAARELLADAHRRRGDDKQLALVLEKAVTLDAPGAALHAELARLLVGPLADAGKAWAQAARGYALEPTGEEGLACRALLFGMFDAVATAEGQELAGRRLVSTLTEIALGLSSASAREARLSLDLAEIEGMGEAVSESALVPLWRAILRTRPALGPVLDTFERWSRREADQSWLAEALELRVGASAVEARTGLELELGFVLASLSGRQDQAIATFERVLKSAHADEEQRELAFDGLDELLDKNNRHEARARLLEARLSAPAEPERLARIRLALANTRWRRLGDASGAVDLLVQLVGASAVPASVSAGAVDLLETIWGEGTERSRIYRALEPVYAAARDWDKLVALYTSTLEQDDPQLQIECLTKLAELERSELDRPEAAFSTLLALIERESDPIVHLGELEVLAGRLGRWEELASRLEALVGLGHGGAPLMARLARVHEVERHDPERAAHFYRFAFEDDASDTASRDALSGILERSERWDELVRHLLAAADRESADAAAGHATTSDRHLLRRRAAEILDKQLAQPSEAVAVLELIGAEAAPESPVHAEAQEAAAQILERTQDYAALHKHYRRWVEVAPTDQLAVDLQVRLGRSLIRFPTTAREGLTELEEVWRTAPSRRDVIPALWSMIVACERAESAAGGIVGGAASARAGTSAIDPLYAEATADAARLLEEIIGDNAPATTLAGIVQAQLRVLPAGEERQATLIRLARLMTDLEAPERAFGYLAEALRGDLESASIEGELEAIAESHGYWDALAALYEECSGDGDEHASERYVLKVGNILSERLGRAEEAASWYERYLLAQPGSRDAVEPLVAYYREVADAASEARVLEAWIEYSASADELPALRMRLGVLRMDQLGDAQGAIDALEGCLPEGAADAELVRRLERLYVRGEHFPALVELYRAALSHLVGDAARGEALQVLAKMTQVYETRLADLPSARGTARRMLELEALNRFALTSLERIERALGDWDAVDEILGKKLEATPVEAARVKILIDRAEVAAQHRQRPDEAIEFLLVADRIVGPGPGQDELVKGLESLLRSEPVVRLKAAKALAKRYRPREAWQSLINVLMIELVASSEPGERFALATQAAEIAAERLRDKPVALRVLVTALRQSPELAELRVLIDRTAREIGDYAMVLKTGDDMLRRGVPEGAVVGFALWLGALERNHGDRARAIAAYERVLEFEPGHGEAGDALAALYRDGGDWTALKGLHTQRLAVAAAGERPMLELDHALNLAGHQGVEATVAAVQALLAAHVGEPRFRATLLSRVSEPVAGPAATAVLANELKAAGRWAELIKLYEIRADKTPSVEEQVRLWREAAAVSETQIGDRVVAVKFLGRAAEASPSDLGPWRELRALAMRIGAHEELARVLARGVEAADPAIVPELAIGLAELEASHLGLEDGIEKARSTLRMGLDQSPGDLTLHEALVRLELGVGDLAAVEAEVSALTDLIEDDAVACGWWRELRALAEQKGDEARVVVANEALLARDHRDADAAEHLASSYRKSARWDDLVELLFLRIEAAEEPEEAAAHWREVAQLRAGPLGDVDGALEAWQEAWALWSGSAEATRKLVAHAAERGEWSEVASLWERHAEAAPTVADQAVAWVELGRVRDEKLKLSDEALEAFEAAATLAGEAPELAATALAALNALVGIHGRTRRFAELAATLERKAEVAVTRPEKALAWVQAAAVRLDQLREPGAARPILERVLALDPDHLEGRLLLARLLVREGRAAEAVTTLKDLVVRTEGKRRVRLLMDLARLQANEVGDPVGASSSVDEALSLDPQTPGLEALALDVMARAESWPRLRELLERSFASAKSDADRADRALRLARLFAGPLADEEALGRWLAEAQAAEPGSVEVRALEAERLEQRGDLIAAEVVWSEVVELLAGRRAAEELMRASHRLGLLRERLGRTEAALAAFKRAHDIDGKYVPNLIDYGRALVVGGHWSEALAIHQSLLLQRHLIGDEAERLAVLERLALASWEAGQRDRAKAYLQKLLGERADHAGGLALRQRFEEG